MTPFLPCAGLLFDALLPCPTVVSFLRSAFLSPRPRPWQCMCWLRPRPGSGKATRAPELSPRLSLLLSLQTAPEQFPSEEFPISESKVNLDVTFPGAAFVVVSCKESQSGFRKE